MRADVEEERMIQYLLGQLPLEEQAEIEDRYICDAAYFERICAVEESLIDDYLTGAMESMARRRFEETYMTNPERRKRVEFAGKLRETLKLHIKAESFNARPAQKPTRATEPAPGLWYLLSPGLARGTDDRRQIVALSPGTGEIMLELDLNAARNFDSY